ncbi:hypothetical protein EVAR_78969_1 [Eumeta japonica]|uniref:Mariner Mos1 transposase n=1 Tax=Eumeta variegata TaxID=151549 RepID=A0A4C1US43_EUMVA|nr:hypothetical protein EVAR_78969_1 [Eumeta japonica]
MDYLRQESVKRSWLKGKETPQTIANLGLTRNKLMLCVWWDWKVHYELLPPGKIFKSDLYCHQLIRLNKRKKKNDVRTPAVLGALNRVRDELKQTSIADGARGRLLAPQRQSGVTTSPSQFGPWEYIDKCTKIGKNNYLTTLNMSLRFVQVNQIRRLLIGPMYRIAFNFDARSV